MNNETKGLLRSLSGKLKIFADEHQLKNWKFCHREEVLVRDILNVCIEMKEDAEAPG